MRPPIPLALALTLALPLVGHGCAETACFVYTAGELAAHGDACPAPDEALASFAHPSCPALVTSVDGAGEFRVDAERPDQGLCCYPVTRRAVHLDPERSDCLTLDGD